MFTGIIEEVGTVTRADVRTDVNAAELRLVVEAELVSNDLHLGDSVAVSGCCLTVVALGERSFAAELSRETLAKTAPRWQVGSRVNLERALSAGGRFGGHIVSGHVEGVGEVLAVRRDPGAYVVTVRAPTRLAPYFIPKGSVTVDGVSLTLVDVGGPGGSSAELETSDFTLWLIPHTLAATTLGELEVGSSVNLEADLLAKYAERLTLLRNPGQEGIAQNPSSPRPETVHAR